MTSVPFTANMPEIPEPRHSPNAHFLIGEIQSGESEKGRLGGSMAASLAWHAGLALFFLFVIARMPPPSPTTAPPERMPADVIWLNSPGPGGGGGGGGNKNPDPPKKAELPGKEKITVPVAKPPAVTPEPPKPEPPKPTAQLNIPAVNTAAGIQEMAGTLTGLPAVVSQGSGSGGGAGTGTGSGIGPGSGSGLGPGTGGGTGGGAYRPGNGVIMPTVLSEVKPSYTADAMRQKIQGIVMVEAVVMPDGGVGQVQIVRSLDPTFGLDQEAVKAVRRWRFRPGTRFGQAVPVLVEIELTFTLR
jgi:periplasmic protein TonB